MGVHRMANPSTEKVAISLHIYSPAYNQCSVFDQATQQRRSVSICTLYDSYPFMKQQVCWSPLRAHHL